MDVELFGGKYRIRGRSVTGRRETNQDMYAWVACSSGRTVGEVMDIPLHPADTDHPDMLMAVVCDGMGGMEHGEIASDAVCRGLVDWFEDAPPADPALMRRSMVSALEEIERDLRRMHPRSGTTMTAILAVNGSWTSANLGDSRCYRVNGDDVWRTRDDSPVEDMFRSGAIDEDGMNTSPLGNLVDRYLGGGFATSTTFSDLGTGWDRLALCSDGAFGYMSAADFRNLLRTADWPDAIQQAAYARGSTDNITVLTVDPLADGGPKVRSRD